MASGFHQQSRHQAQGQWVELKSVQTITLNALKCPVCSYALCDPYFIARAYYGNMNFFGGPSTTSVKASAKLKQLEEENEDAMFVIVSDVWLDSVEVMEKLNLMFSGVLQHPGLRLYMSSVCTLWDTNKF